MNLDKIIEMQRVLDEKIIREKGLEGQDLIANTFVALQVELAEMANEGRWFKHWKTDRSPRIKASRWEKELPLNSLEVEYYNPLLEEFVDAVHFFLSIAIQKGWEETLWVYEEQVDPDDYSGDLTGYYLEMIYFLNSSYIRIYSAEENEKCKYNYGFTKNQYDFRMAWILFLNIGFNGFGFTWEDVFEAYMDKNKVNHERQANGY